MSFWVVAKAKHSTVDEVFMNRSKIILRMKLAHDRSSVSVGIPSCKEVKPEETGIEDSNRENLKNLSGRLNYNNFKSRMDLITFANRSGIYAIKLNEITN